MGRPVVHWELWSEDPKRLSDFYKDVFDWEIRHIPEMDYHLVETKGEGGDRRWHHDAQTGALPAIWPFTLT